MQKKYVIYSGKLNEIKVTSDLCFHYQVDLEKDKPKPETIRFFSADDSYNESIEITNGTEQISLGWVELIFKTPPKGVTLNMTQKPDDSMDEFYIFAEQTLEDVKKLDKSATQAKAAQ